jgi:2-(1,2-epoxy-1,2-dihydrophenyl)acetyl-CoA isomerase
MDRTVLLDVHDRVATVTLSRPDSYNALTLEVARELLSAALRCEADPEIRAVVLTGAGKHFCFGGDLRAMREQGDAAPGYLNELTTHLHAAISAFTRMRAPVIAAINGTAAGAGVGLVCAADLALCARGSRFSLAYTGVGLAPDGSVSFLLPRIVGRRRAMELLLLNRVLSAEEALAWGLVNQVLDDAELVTHSQALAAKLAAGPTEAFGATKRLMGASSPGLESQMALEGRTIAAMSSHPHGREGIAAFIEKRQASYP